MKKTIIIIAIILAIIAGLFFLKNAIAKTLLSGGVRVITGLKLSIGRLNVVILEGKLYAKDIKVYNPPDFPDKLMIDMPEIFIDFNIRGFFKKQIHFEALKINLKEFIVVRNKEGQVNLDSLKLVKDEKEKQGEEPEEIKDEPSKFRVDVLDLAVGKVLFKDYTKGEKPEVKTYNIDINQRFQNVTNTSQLGSIIIMKVLMKTAIPTIVGFPIKIFADTAGTVLKGATFIALEGGKIVGKTVGKTVEEVGKVIEDILPFKKKEN